MIELTDKDAINIALMYYGQKFNPDDTGRMVANLSRADVIGLVKYAFKQGAKEAEAKHKRLRITINKDEHTRLIY